MKVSMFNIPVEDQGKIIVYNTFTTSLILLNKELYQDIFVNKNMTSPEVNNLYDMGFLIDDECDEVAEMEHIRSTVIKNSSKKIGNVIIAPTLLCNAHCFYCFENGYREGKMTTETADALVEFLLNNWNEDKLGITWFGGEPLLAADIISYVSQQLKNRGVRIGSRITTNGSLLSEEILTKAVNEWDVEQIQITVDGVGEEYNEIKNYDKQIINPFVTVINNIRQAIEFGIKVRIRINFDPDNQEQAIETMNYLLEEFHHSDLVHIYFAPIDEDDAVVRNITNDFSDLKEHPLLSLIKFGRKHQLYRGFPDMEENFDKFNEYDPESLLKKFKMYPCPINCYGACPNVFSIAPNGDIYKCHRVLGRKEFASGNVKIGIVENEAYRFFCNTNPTYDECNTCSILPICQGGCKANDKIYLGKGACAASKAIIKDLILLYREDLSNLK